MRRGNQQTLATNRGLEGGSEGFNMYAGYVPNVCGLLYFWESPPFLCQKVVNIKVGRKGAVVRLGDAEARNKRAKETRRVHCVKIDVSVNE